MKTLRAFVGALLGVATLFGSNPALAQAVQWQPKASVPEPTSVVLVQTSTGIVRENQGSVEAAKDRVAQLTAQGKTAQVACKWAVPVDPVSGTAAPRTRAPRGSSPVMSWLNEIGMPPPARPFMGKGVKVAVIDTGIDRNHPHLRGALLPGIDIGDSDADPQDDIGHGTHVAGILHSTAPAAKIIPIKVVSSGGYADDGLIAAGFDAAIALKADVISISMGRTEGFFSAEVLHQAIQRALNAGIVIVAAAGNEMQPTENTVPNNHPGVISVEATHHGVRSLFSNYGGHIAAPGWSIWSSLPSGQYGDMSGTSMSCPMVSGTVAALLGRNPRLTQSQVLAKLVQGGDQATQWQNRTIPHLNVSHALGLRSANVHGQVMNALSATYGGANVANVTIRANGRVVGRTDARGCFALTLRPGRQVLTVDVLGAMLLEPQTIQLSAQQTVRLTTPLMVVPVRSDNVASVLVTHRTYHAFSAYAEGEGVTLDQLPDPVGSWHGIDLLSSFGDRLGARSSLLTYPYTAFIRDGFGGDAHPVASYLLAPGSASWTVQVSNFYARRYYPADPEWGYPEAVSKSGRKLGESGLRVYVIQRDKVIAKIACPEGDPNDTATEAGAAKWLACKVHVSETGEVSVAPMQEILLPMPEIPDVDIFPMRARRPSR